MKKVRYYWAARILRSLLLISFIFSAITLVVNVSSDLFKFKPYVRYGNLTFGSTQQGHKLKAILRLNIPDTVINYKDGQESIFKELEHFSPSNKQREERKRREITDITVNNITAFENEEVTVFNPLLIQEPIDLYVSSTNKKYSFFFSLAAQLDLLFTIFFFLLLVKLLKRYMEYEMFEQRTFKLIAGFGWLIILKEILAFVFGYINSNIMGVRFLQSIDMSSKKRYNFINLSLDFYNVYSFYKIGVGLLIILIAYVIKEAIAAKKENELTI